VGKITIAVTFIRANGIPHCEIRYQTRHGLFTDEIKNDISRATPTKVSERLIIW